MEILTPYFLALSWYATTILYGPIVLAIASYLTLLGTQTTIRPACPTERLIISAPHQTVPVRGFGLASCDMERIFIRVYFCKLTRGHGI
jgi:hypothetical protein